MLFWILVAILTAALAAFLLLPLQRAASHADIPEAHDVEVYRDQMAELSRDQASGLISGDDANFARAEVGRRLLAASDAVKATADTPVHARSNRLAQLAVVVVLPAIGLCLYLMTGSPEVPDAPLAARLQNMDRDPNLLIAQAERKLVTNPDDGAGWDLLAPIYYRTGRIDDAAAAYQNALRLLGDSPVRLGGYAESVIALSGGLVTNDAQTALRKSLTMQPGDPRAEFYLALALKQQGKSADALAAFRRLVSQSPADAPWLPLVNEHIASLEADAAAPAANAQAPGNPTGEDIANAQEMTEGDRNAMIEGMVESLSARLAENPDNFEGWLRLVRSYSVLGQKDKAVVALKEGLKAFPQTDEQGKQLLALAGELGLDMQGANP